MSDFKTLNDSIDKSASFDTKSNNIVIDNDEIVHVSHTTYYTMVINRRQSFDRIKKKFRGLRVIVRK